MDGIPAKLLEAVQQFEEWLVSELNYQISLALDQHCLAALAASTPPSGLEGEALWVQVRNAVKAMRASGAGPSVLAVNPDDAAALDTMTAGADKLPVFALRDVGSSSPLFGLNLVEVPNLTAPMLIDPGIAAILYLGMARVFADPFTGLHKNEVRLRVECEALLHIRDTAGIYVVHKSS